MQLELEGVITNGTTDKQREAVSHPFIDFYYEDKSKYKTAREAGYIDPDDDFLIGESGGFLLNIDFKLVNTHLLRPAANHYNKYGNFTNSRGANLKKFREEEEHRRKYGFTAPCKLDRKTGKIKDLRITGAHYNFINYTNIVMLDEESVVITADGKQTGKKHNSFPKVFESQYWYYKVKEFAIANGFNTILCKTRRAGFSYMEAADSANSMNLTPDRIFLHCAKDKKFLTMAGGLTDFTFKNLLFYENHTPFKRGFISKNIEELSLGFLNSKREPDPRSWNTQLLSLSMHNNSSVAVGKDSENIKVEELSEADNFNEFYEVTEPTLRTGSIKTGTMNGWGTGGAKGGKWYVFEQNYYDPESIGCMPFENVWDKDARNTTCGFFKPYIWCLQGSDGEDATDKDGNPNFKVALEISNRERKHELEKKSMSDYIVYCGQYANNPAESFNSVSENIFSDPRLEDWIEELKHNDAYRFYTDGKFVRKEGKLKFISNAQIHAKGGKLNQDYYEYIINVPRRGVEHPHGCIRIFFHPKRENGVIPDGLYGSTYDPVGINKENKDITLKHSHNSISVWENPHAINGYKSRLVAKFYGRPESLEEADAIFRDLCEYYNIKGMALVEVNRGETVSNFKKWNCTKYLQKEPTNIWDNKGEIKESTNWGITIGDGDIKLSTLRLYREYLYTKVGVRADGSDLLNLHGIYDLQSLMEIKKWSNVGNFDRVSEMILRGIQQKSKDIKAKGELETRKRVTDTNHPLQRDWY